jgi:hypothetical protein
MFQFDRSDMTLRTDASRIVAELVDTFDSWDLAAWFARPNAWLQDMAPVDRVGIDFSAVLHAARADRFIARG